MGQFHAETNFLRFEYSMLQQEQLQATHILNEAERRGTTTEQPSVFLELLEPKDSENASGVSSLF